MNSKSQEKTKNPDEYDSEKFIYMITLGKSSDQEHINKEKPGGSTKKISSNVKLREEMAQIPNYIESTPEIESDEEDTFITPIEEEEEESETSILFQMKKMYYTNIESFADIFVNEIIDISLEVCETLYKATFGESEEVVKELRCLCEKSDECINKSSSDVILKNVKGFLGWPTIKNFSLKRIEKQIRDFMNQWYFVEDWKYSLNHIANYSDSVSDFYLFQGMWSIPTKEYPVSQATASIYFTVEVSRVKPKFCLVDVTLQFEGSSTVHRANQFQFMEQWLFNIIDAKLLLFKSLRF